MDLTYQKRLAAYARAYCDVLYARLAAMARDGEIIYKGSIFVIRRHHLQSKVRLGNNQTARNVYSGCNNNAICSDRAISTFPTVVIIWPQQSIGDSFMPSDTIVQLCQKHYRCQDIEIVKRKLFEVCPTEARYVQRKGHKKNTINLDDIVKRFHELDPDADVIPLCIGINIDDMLSGSRPFVDLYIIDT